VSMQLLERADQLDTLHALLDEAASGRGRLLFVGGEAGVGKTALVSWFVERLQGKARVLIGACDSLATPRPLGPLEDMGLDLASRHGQSSALFGGFLEELDSGRRATVAIFEDVHWADQATLDLLRFMGRRIGNRKALVVATFRDDEVGPRHLLRVVLGDLAGQPAVRRMALPSLSLDAVSFLARDSAIDAAQLYRKTGGNPFFVVEVLLSGLEGIPVTVRDAVLARAARLSLPARDVLDAAAIYGLEVETWLLDAISDVSAGALGECVDSGLLRRQGPVVAFRHELARGAIAEAVDAARSVALHRDVVQVLRARPEVDAARIAYHAEAAGDREAVLASAPSAAKRAARFGAHREAAAEYGRALRFADGLPPEVRAKLWEGRAFECFISDQLEHSMEAREAAIEAWRQVGDSQREGDNLRWLARSHWVAGRAQLADEALTDAVELLESGPPSAELAMAYTARGYLSMLLFRNQQALQWSERALRLEQRFHDVGARTDATICIGLCRIAAGEDSGFQTVEETIRVAERAGLVDHVARACFHCAQITTIQRRHSLSKSWFDRGHTYCVEHEHEGFRRAQLVMRARSLLNQGDWAEAEAMAADVRFGTHPPDWRHLVALTVLSLVRARRGEPRAVNYIDETADYVASLGPELSWTMGMPQARAEIAWLAGDPDRAHTEASSAMEGVLRMGEPWGVGELAYWLWRSGGTRAVPAGAAEPWVRQIESKAEEAAALWEKQGCPYEAAQALAESDREPALRRALEILQDLGAKPMAASVRRRLRGLGALAIRLGPRAATRQNPAGLTARELEVLRLLVDGLPNREIGERLYVSRRTVEHQVESILGKLGVTSRTAAAREASHLGLTEPRADSGRES
jgi:DNA-binding CsgD family transcriptional regulator/tetratricopeptide (TPR) repeat protein